LEMYAKKRFVTYTLMIKVKNSMKMSIIENGGGILVDFEYFL